MKFVSIFFLALGVASCNGAATRNLVGCNEQCSTQGNCPSGKINTCHSGQEDECIDPNEWNEHCTDSGDTCGPCANSDGDGGGGGCFSSASTLLVRGKGLVPMGEAQIGDMVLTSAAGKYEPLFAFGHYKADASSEFLKIKTTLDTLEVTGEHLLHVVGKEHPVRADSITVGDSLYHALEGTARVLKTSTITNKGLYAPLTPSGKIVVNNMVASSYIALTEDDSEYVSLGPWSMSHSDLVHLTLAPFRVVCMGVNDKPCHVYDEEGIAMYIRWGMTIVRAAHNEGALWSYLVLFFGMPLVYFARAWELVFGPSFAMLAFFAVCVSASFWRKSAAGKVKMV